MHLQCNICNSCVTLQLPCSHSYCAVRGSSPIALQSILIPAMECWVQILGCNEIEMVFFSNHVLLRFKNLEAYFWFVLVALLACVGLFATLPRTDSEFVVSGADLFLGRFLIKEGNQKRHRLTGFRIDGEMDNFHQLSNLQFLLQHEGLAVLTKSTIDLTRTIRRSLLLGWPSGAYPLAKSLRRLESMRRRRSSLGS